MRKALWLTALVACTTNLSTTQHTDTIYVHNMAVMVHTGAPRYGHLSMLFQCEYEILGEMTDGLDVHVLPCNTLIDASNPRVMGRYYAGQARIEVRGCDDHVFDAVPHELTHHWLWTTTGNARGAHDYFFQAVHDEHLQYLAECVKLK